MIHYRGESLPSKYTVIIFNDDTPRHPLIAVDNSQQISYGWNVVSKSYDYCYFF